jgi:hypothetical protein
MIDTSELIEIDTANTAEELCKKEIGYIIEYNSYYMNENGYNMTYGGEGTNGYVNTEEDKQKMSNIKKKYIESNPDVIQKMNEIRIKYYQFNPEAKKQTNEKISESMKNHFKNPEAVKKNSEAIKKYYKNNPNAVKEHSERMKKYSENPELKRTLSDGKGKNKPFDIFTKEGKYIKTFNYQFEAKEFLQKEYNITKIIKIGEVLSGNQKTSAGFVFKFK